MSCDSPASSLRVSDIAWGPRPGRPLIADISFRVSPSERLAIVGPNGAGKSTLLRCLYRANRPQRGAVFLDGEDIWALSSRRVAQKVAAVLQEMPADFPFSVRDVVVMGRIPHRAGLTSWSDRDHFQVEHALDHLDLRSLADRAFASLSGGEKQRALVARALAQQPRLIILDEPTNHLDIRHQLEILQLLKGLRLTIVTTLHDINLAAGFADRIALMAHGRVIAFGTPDETLTGAALSTAFSVTAHRDVSPDGTGARFSFSLTPSAKQEMKS
jgi:iron complex transport system ATP-binding protein